MIYNESTGKLIMAESDEVDLQEKQSFDKQYKVGKLKNVKPYELLKALGFTAKDSDNLIATNKSIPIFYWWDKSVKEGVRVDTTMALKAGLSLTDTAHLTKMSTNDLVKLYDYVANANKLQKDIVHFIIQIIADSNL